MKVLAIETPNQKKISEIIFSQLLKNAKCDTDEHLGQVGFISTVVQEEYTKTRFYELNFYGDMPKYNLQIDPHATYILEQDDFEEERIIKIIFSEKQKAKMQALIDAMVLEITDDEKEQNTDDIFDLSKEISAMNGCFIGGIN